MLSNKCFIGQSLELNLFFLRIMKEHSLFLEAGFTPSNSELSSEAEAFKNEFSRLLIEAISLSYGVISPEVLASEEIVTPYTLSAERATEFYTSIKIDSRITEAEYSLGSGMSNINMHALWQQVFALNERAIVATNALANFKDKLLRDVLSCRLFTANYPLLIDHILREARLYLNSLIKLQSQKAVDLSIEAVENEGFWNRIMAEHSKFIRGLLDPTEEQLIDTANNFGKEFDILTKKALALHDEATLLPVVTEESKVATARLKQFNTQGTEGILQCKVKSIILPLLGDHVLRESARYLRLLNSYSSSYVSL